MFMEHKPNKMYQKLMKMEKRNSLMVIDIFATFFLFTKLVNPHDIYQEVAIWFCICFIRDKF